MRIAVCHPQTPFVRGGAEMHTEALARALRVAGHDAEIVSVPWKWHPPVQLVHQMALWRSLDLSESNGLKIDAVIALRFPAYLIRHHRKIVWLIHQHRTAYELWDHPRYSDLSRQPEGAAVRDMIWQADRIGLGEANRIFTNSSNVKERLERSIGLPAEVLYHPSPMTQAMINVEPGEYGDYLVFPSRLDSLKRQSLAIEAMKYAKTPVRLILVGSGPDEDQLRHQVQKARLSERVLLRSGVPDAELQDLFLNALGVYYGPFDEDYGYVTLEGLAAQRPVVSTSDSGGPLEFITDGETGLVVPPEPEEIGAAFDRLHKDRRMAEKLGTAGRELVRTLVPSWPEVVSRLLT